jgi:hypothetical protein
LVALPSFILLSAAVALGVVLGLQYLRGERSSPLVMGAHLLLGAGGLETIAMLLRGTPDGTVAEAGSLGRLAAMCLLGGMASGLLAPMIGRRSVQTMNVALITHIGVAAAGFLLFLGWMLRL